MPNYQNRDPNTSGQPKRRPQATGQPPQNDFRVGEVRAAPVIALDLSAVMDADRLLEDGPDIDFTDGGPKAGLSFTLKTTGIAPATYGAALKIPVITFDDKGRATLASEVSLGTAAALNSDNDPTLAANSNSRLPTQFAVRSFVSQAVAGLLEYKNDLNCSSNPNYPVGEKGDAYLVTVAGKVGGASGKAVDVGDFIIARADNAGGTEVAVGASWFVLEHNLAGALLAANNLSDLGSASAARSNLGLAIGSDVQAHHAKLDAYAGGDMPSSFVLGLVDAADATALRTALEVPRLTEGTWAPICTPGAGALTSYTAAGRYTRIGNLVCATATVTVTNNGTGSILLFVTLPFTADSAMGYWASGREVAVTGNMLQVEVAAGSSVASILTYNNAYPVGAGYTIGFTVWYKAVP